MKRINYVIDFIGIGAEKSGSTWIGQCIAEHPEVYFPKNREIFFFNDIDGHYLKYPNTRYSRGIDWYKRLYKHSPKGKKKGDWSIAYISSEETARRIHSFLPEVKLIAILRNPVDRIISQYVHEIRLGLIDKSVSIDEILKVRPDYIEKGYYAKQLKWYLKYFKKKQVLVLIYEEVKKNPDKYIRQIFKYLGLKNVDFKPRSLTRKINGARSPAFPKLNSWMIKTEYFLRKYGMDPILSFFEASGIRQAALWLRDLSGLNFRYPKVNDSTRRYLRSIFAKDVSRLEKLLNTSFSIWNE